MNRAAKMLMVCAAGLWCCATAEASAPLVTVDGRQIFADFERSGSPERFFIQGVGYSPVPIGRPGMQWGESNIFDDEAILRRDFQLLYDMNANAIRIWKADETNNALNEFPNFMTDRTLTIADEYGIKVIPGFWLGFAGWWECRPEGRVFVWDPNFFDLQAKTVRAHARADILGRWEQFIEQFKGRPEILFWAIGNENNLQLGDDEALVRAFYSLINEMAQIAHALDPDHPVAFVNGGITAMVPDGQGGTKNIFGDDLAPDLDIWGVNLYSGETFGDFFDEYAARSQKPLWIAEFGIDAWHSIIGHPDGGYEDQQTQAQWVSGLWDEIVEHQEIASGATVMAYSDEWWKPYQWLCQNPGWEEWWRPYWELYPDGSGLYACGVFNDTHDLFGIGPLDTTCDGIPDWFPPAPDAFFNEEWWGIMSVQRGLEPDAPDVMTPRLVYAVLADQFSQGLNPSPKVASAVPDSAQPGDLVVIQGKFFGEYRADPGFDPACDLNRDGSVNDQDLNLFALSYNRRAGEAGFLDAADFNRDGRVDIEDFRIFLRSYRKSSGQTYVVFGGNTSASARIEHWNNTEIRCRVPYGAESGLMTVRTPHGESEGLFVDMVADQPVVSEIIPGQASAGDLLTVRGEGFGAFTGTLNYYPDADFNGDGVIDTIDYNEFQAQLGQAGPNLSADFNGDGRVDTLDLAIFNAAWQGRRGTRYFQFTGGVVARVISWDDTEAVIKVPARAQTGRMALVTEDGPVDAGHFVMLPLMISGLSLSSASWGDVIEITGQGFEDYQVSGRYDPAMDLNRDGRVDSDDFMLFAAAYNSVEGDPRFDPRMDYNRDGRINVSDFSLFLSAYGSSRGLNHVLFGGDVEGRVISWTTGRIVCVVPRFAVSGDVRVVVRGLKSNGKPLEIF